jgi:hypothetical protein
LIEPKPVGRFGKDQLAQGEIAHRSAAAAGDTGSHRCYPLQPADKQGLRDI